MKKKKAKEAGYLLSFLDVLSNSMAAVLILTIVRLQPSTPGAFTPGIYSINAVIVDNNPLKENSALTFSVKLIGEDRLHIDADYVDTDFRLFKSPRTAKLKFLREVNLYEIESIICHIDNPNYQFTANTVLIDVNLPGLEKSFNVNLDASNSRRFAIVVDGRLNM
ncbi:MAG: hypothetical protein AAFO03_27365 [Bacteroidota bacterium]